MPWRSATARAGRNASVAIANTVSVGTASATRKIVNVSQGTISATSTDAVNGRALRRRNTR